MKRLYYLALVLLFFACNHDKEIEKSAHVLLDLNLHDESFSFGESKIYANGNCNLIFMNVSQTSSQASHQFRLEMALTKQGGISDIRLYDYSDNNRHYQAADFNAAEDFTFHTFQYDSINNSIEVDFEGVLYELDHPNNTLPLSGKAKFLNMEEVPCNYEGWSINADINRLPFKQVELVGTTTDAVEQWLSLSDDGFKITILTEQPLEEMPLGTYTFSQSDYINLVTLEKYVGISKAISLKPMEVEDWEYFQYEGELVIEERMQHDEILTRGKFTVKAYRKGILVYEVTNGEFLI